MGGGAALMVQVPLKFSVVTEKTVGILFLLETIFLTLF